MNKSYGMNNCLIYIYIIMCVALGLLSSCGGASRGGSNGAEGDTIRMKYAEHITMVARDGYTLVELKNPWKEGTVLHSYALVDHADSARFAQSGHVPSGVTVVYTPVRRGVVFTSPHCWLLCQLGAGNAIKGVCDLSYINVPYVQQAAASGRVADCGNGMSPSVERIVDIAPEALFVSPYQGVSYGQLDHIGVPLVECADYMETSALGRAEWMRFYGRLVGRGQSADSLFAVVERNYASLKKAALKSRLHPRVITERVVSGVWYCPGGKSSMAGLIADAGGKYVFAADSHSGSLTLSPEKVLEQAAAADVWMFIYNGKAAPTRGELLSEYSGYKMIKAFNSGGVYGCGSATGVPYFEEISFRPDFLLRDFISVFHPDIHAGATPRYYKRLAL